MAASPYAYSYIRSEVLDVIIRDTSVNPVLYAWTIESGATVSPSSASTFYTKTPNPVYSGGVNDVEIFDAQGNKYTDIMSWTLTKNGNEMGETYVVDASSEAITLNAIGPA